MANIKKARKSTSVTTGGKSDLISEEMNKLFCMIEQETKLRA
jgi:hypothetical protein